jgi:predicted  nucleic acid-binding Zn-ribbon protein
MAVAIADQIKSLAELQKLDTQIHRMNQEAEACPIEKKKLDEAFEKKKAGLKAAEEALKHLQVQQKSKENDLLSREDKIAKLKSQLYSLKTNKEYQAMELEIKGGQADKSLLEEEILKMFDAVEEARAKVAREKEALAGLEKEHKTSVAALEKRAAELAASAAELNEKRKVHLPGVDSRLLTQYEKVLKKRDGIALVPVVHHACGGCHVELPPQIVNEVQIGEKLITCESCARILYWAG